MLSKDSNVITLALIGQSDSFERPYYSKAEMSAMARASEQRYEQLSEYTEGLEDRIRALEERMEPDPEGGDGNG